MNRLLKTASAVAVVAVVAACDSGSSTAVSSDAQFEVTITNLTLAQPLSPAAVIMHRRGYNSFVDGETASADIEQLAEGGDNAPLLGSARAANQHVSSGSTAGPVPPQSRSDSVTLDVPTADLADLQLSVVTMLVHTNDAITGANAFDVSGMAVGESRVVVGPSWDSGTEANTETGISMPGPDFGGEGFNAARDDSIDSVRIHAGVVTGASTAFGLASSDLEDRHRFLNPTSRIAISRTR